jgi:copper chaperone CopZ
MSDNSDNSEVHVPLSKGRKVRVVMLTIIFIGFALVAGKWWYERVATAPEAEAELVPEGWSITPVVDPRPEELPPAEVSGPRTVKLTIRGMTCRACAVRVKDVLGKMDGVSEVAASWETGKATITFDPETVDLDAIKAAVAKLNYEVVAVDKG